MLFFIDETWQSTEDRRYKAGALAALPLDSASFNKVSKEVYDKVAKERPEGKAEQDEPEA